MLVVPDPKIVRGLLTRYACLRIAFAENEGRERARELEDVSYTLCITMGARTVDDAVAAADTLLVAQAAGRGRVQEPDGGDGLPTSPADCPAPGDIPSVAP
ncbi:DUF5133 domain-containing protein [Streptomyces sp900105755]|uniref:DUF5133 domain-containing protein n=1 Tax=unclassified Streptomyces TaxID=2593676 RepID=UPI000896E12C|nr:DUF5133 domain-containing protein [Streptomyces sp. Ag109_O5-10]SEF16896.1 protein of unknown function [Streptomyces sp. Ag109_O5-10]